MRFRKKPVVVEAVQVTREMVEARLFDGEPLPDGLSLGRASYHRERRELYHWHGRVTTIHGERAKVEIGDWIIAEPEPGLWYPCKPDIFAATYEPAPEQVEGERRAVSCAGCERVWPWASEQAVAVERQGVCIACGGYLAPGSDERFKEEAIRRRSEGVADG